MTPEPFRKLCAVLVGRRSAPGACYKHIPKPIDASFVQVVREPKAHFKPELAEFPEPQFLPEALLH